MSKTFKRLLFWYYALNKRLIKKVSFLIILLLIPLFTIFMANTAKEESGFVRIALVSEDPADPIAADIIAKVKETTKITVVTECKTEREAKIMVERGEADTAWVLLPDLESRAEKIAAGEKEHLIRVYLSEDNTFVRAAREKLLGMLFPIVSYEIYEDAALKLPLGDEYKTPEFLADAYDIFGEDTTLIEYGYLDSNQEAPKNSDFITAPLRGLLGAVMLLCGLAAAPYFNSDDHEGIFSNLTSLKRGAIYLFNNLAALTISGTFVSIALMLSGNYTSFPRESLMMLLYILCCTGFCTLLGTLLNTPAKLSVALPIVLILSIALSPVFFNVRKFHLIQSFFPLYHYLYGINNLQFALSLGLWAIGYIAVAYMIYTYKNRGYIKR